MPSAHSLQLPELLAALARENAAIPGLALLTTTAGLIIVCLRFVRWRLPRSPSGRFWSVYAARPILQQVREAGKVGEQPGDRQPHLCALQTGFAPGAGSVR